mgnify:CR=1 FL=1
MRIQQKRQRTFCMYAPLSSCIEGRVLSRVSRLDLWNTTPCSALARWDQEPWSTPRTTPWVEDALLPAKGGPPCSLAIDPWSRNRLVSLNAVGGGPLDKSSDAPMISVWENWKPMSERLPHASFFPKKRRSTQASLTLSLATISEIACNYSTYSKH